MQPDVVTIQMAWRPPIMSRTDCELQHYANVKISLPDYVKNSLPYSVKYFLPYDVKKSLPSHVKFCLTFTESVG